MLLGMRLRAERKKRKLSAEQLSLACGVSRSYITLIENGQRRPGHEVIPKIAAALKIKTNIVINWYLEDVREKIEVAIA